MVTETLLVVRSSCLVCRGWWVSENNSYNNKGEKRLSMKHNLKPYSSHPQDMASYINDISDLSNPCSDSSVKCNEIYINPNRCKLENIFF